MENRRDLEFLDRIGQTHLTENWKAFQPTLQRTVMVCMLRPEVLADPDATHAFTQGAKIAARLSHPNILGIYDAVEAPDHCYIIQEFVSGTTLMERLFHGPPLTPAQVFDIVEQIAQGMASAWEQEQLIHANLNPRAILLDPDGVAKVSMIGRCRKAMEPPLHGPDDIVGIPNYMAPEQIRGELELDFRTDIYALGTMLYHMLTGTLPFAELDPHDVLQAHLSGHLIWPATQPEGVPPSIVNLLEHMLMREPGHRPSSWHSLAKNLHKVASGHLIIHKRTHTGESTLQLAGAAADELRHRRKIVIHR